MSSKRQDQHQRERELVEGRIAKHLRGRLGLGVTDPDKAASQLIAKRSPLWMRFFLAASDEANQFKTQRELAEIAGLNERQAKRFWLDLRGMYIRVPAGKFRVFRDGVEIRTRNHGKLDGERFVGGGCLHLSTQPKMGLPLLRTVTDSTKTVTETVAANYRETATEWAGASESLEERAEIEQTRDEVLTGVRPGPTLPLFKTGTGGE